MAELRIDTGTIFTWDDEITPAENIDAVPVRKWLLLNLPDAEIPADGKVEKVVP